MRVLIGTPIHESKDYSMVRWLKNVSSLLQSSPADLLLVDNSPDTNYIKTVKNYCRKYKIENCKIMHIKIDQNLGKDMRIEVSQETIRKYVLSKNYDAWFSWECDQIIPTNALEKLMEMSTMGNFSMVVHSSQSRWDPEIPSADMGLTLIKKECLEKNYFLPTKNGKISHEISDRYTVMFKERVRNKKKYKYVEVYGVIKPIYHLDK